MRPTSVQNLIRRCDEFVAQLRRIIAKRPQLITAGLVLVPSLLYLIRAWQYIATPQLYAEDGSVWLADAYNRGLRSLFSPYNGFAHTTERLFALVVTWFPLRLAPFLFDGGGFALFALMCYYLFSSRLKIFTNNYQKLFVAVSLGLIANFTEFFFNFSNSVFLLGIIGLCIYLARPARNSAVQVLEKLIFVIACLTLPFAWFYLLIVLFEWFRRKNRQLFYLLAGGIGSIIQLLAHLFTTYPRPDIPTSTLASSRYTVLEVYNQIITPGLRFARLDTGVAVSLHQFLLIVLFCLLLGGFSLRLIFRQAPLAFKYLVFFLVVFTAAALKGPLVGGNLTPANILKYMATAQAGNRYFFYGMLCLFLITALAASTYLKRRAWYGFLALFACFGLLTSTLNHDLKVNKGFTNYSTAYRQDVTQLTKSRPGTAIVIPENPAGWSIDLRAK